MVRSAKYSQLCADNDEICMRFPATYWRTLDQRRIDAVASWEEGNAAMQTFGGYGMTVNDDIERQFRETRRRHQAPISTNFVFAYRAEHGLGLPRSYR